MLSFVLIFSICSNVVYATNTSENSLLTREEMLELSPIDVNAISNAWSAMKDTGILTVNDDGLLQL